MFKLFGLEEEKDFEWWLWAGVFGGTRKSKSSECAGSFVVLLFGVKPVGSIKFEALVSCLGL